jgi:hypothetical protein
MIITRALLVATFLWTGGSLLAQAPVDVQKAELSVPFGTAPGTIVVVGDHLVFIDEEKPDMSFAVPRTELRDLTAENGTVRLELRQPVRDRSGERSRLSFERPSSTQ